MKRRREGKRRTRERVCAYAVGFCQVDDKRIVRHRRNNDGDDGAVCWLKVLIATHGSHFNSFTWRKNFQRYDD